MPVKNRHIFDKTSSFNLKKGGTSYGLVFFSSIWSRIDNWGEEREGEKDGWMERSYSTSDPCWTHPSSAWTSLGSTAVKW